MTKIKVYVGLVEITKILVKMFFSQKCDVCMRLQQCHLNFIVACYATNGHHFRRRKKPNDYIALEYQHMLCCLEALVPSLLPCLHDPGIFEWRHRERTAVVTAFVRAI